MFVTRIHWTGEARLAAEYKLKLPELAGHANARALPPNDAVTDRVTGKGSTAPGEPPDSLDGRQFWARPQLVAGAFGSTATNEKPAPSVLGYQVGS